MKEHLIALGIMTGNSLDGVDTVITDFAHGGTIIELASGFTPFPSNLADGIRALRDLLRVHNGDVAKADIAFGEAQNDRAALSRLHSDYLYLIAQACRSTIDAAIQDGVLANRGLIDVIGFHGQTCAHLPPSLSKGDTSPYTIQLGDGQELANMLGIPVIYDFRSDDIMHGGEGAPLAPLHHLHLAEVAKAHGEFPIAFANAGNTGNLSIITHRVGTKAAHTLGWDTGPFNHFSDMLAREECHKTHDIDGAVGATGKVNKALLQVLFNQSAITSDGSNFLTKQPPRSSDPQWYRAPQELLGKAPLDGEILSLPDRMRTAEYFAAYCVAHSLTFVPGDCEMPAYYGLCGGGWKNPIVIRAFRELLTPTAPPIVLDEHRAAYKQLLMRLANKTVMVELTSAYGFNPQAMEARILADAAVHRVWKEPFTLPQTTGVRAPCICGVVRFPKETEPKDYRIGAIMDAAGTLYEATHAPKPRDSRFSRALPGWQSA
jgi:anhydro-N-acetylmuramic acid kinase